jgi:putative spermidine/putrescine transport system permease protein
MRIPRGLRVQPVHGTLDADRMSKPQARSLAPRLGISVRALTVIACTLLIAPQLVVAVTSLDPSEAALFPPTGFSLRWYLNAFERPAFREAFGLSMIVATAASAIAVLAGTMASILVVRYQFIGRGLLTTVLQLPMMIPEVVLGLGFLILFAQWHMHVSMINILLAHAVITLPYAVRVITANLQTVSRSIEEAAYVLGAGPIVTLWRVTLPVIRPGLLAAAIFSFVVSFDNFTITAFLVTGRGTLPIEIYAYIRTEGDPTIAAISTLLIVISLAIVLVAERLVGFERITSVEGDAR